jgi:hypothetical protein
MAQIINREAGDKAKGPRLQRLRCVTLVLDAIEKSHRPYIYAAVEHKEDVFVKDISAGSDYLEQNKNYDNTSAFTFNSPEVINTMIGFCDIWVEYAVKSKDVYLGFYSTNSIGKENKTEAIKKLNIELPDKSILELLQEKKWDYKNLLESVKSLILEEYETQYSGKKGVGNIADLKAYKNEDWEKFLSSIDWKFGEFDEIETKRISLEKIKKCKFFDSSCIGRETSILRNLMDLLDERQCSPDILGKFVNSSDVELIFSQAGAQVITPRYDDPVYRIWASLPKPLDKRNIIDKIQDVCPSPNIKMLQRFSRKTGGAKILQHDKENDKSFLSLRYRIYEKCEQELSDYINKNSVNSQFSNDDIEKLFKHLFTCGKSYVDQISGEFSYSLKSEPVVEGIILELFDSCYLAID